MASLTLGPPSFPGCFRDRGIHVTTTGCPGPSCLGRSGLFFRSTLCRTQLLHLSGSPGPIFYTWGQLLNIPEPETDKDSRSCFRSPGPPCLTNSPSGHSSITLLWLRQAGLACQSLIGCCLVTITTSRWQRFPVYHPLGNGLRYLNGGPVAGMLLIPALLRQRQANLSGVQNPAQSTQ